MARFRAGNSLSETGGRHHRLADRVQRLRVLGPGQQAHHRALCGVHSGAGNTQQGTLPSQAATWRTERKLYEDEVGYTFTTIKYKTLYLSFRSRPHFFLSV